MAVLDYLKSARDISGNIPTTIISRMADTTVIGDVDTAEYRALQYAVNHYSLFAPRELSLSITPTNGAYEYNLNTLISSDFNLEDYNVHTVVYPANNGQKANIGSYIKDQIDEADWDVYLNPDDGYFYLRFMNTVEPTDLFKMYIYYTAPHKVSITDDNVSVSETDSVPTRDKEALTCLIASRLLFIAANYHAQQEEATLSLENAGTLQRSNTYNERSKNAYKMFEDHMNMRPNNFSTTADWDMFADSGDDLFFLEYWNR